MTNVAKLFFERFSAEPRMYRAPGRVNLLGEHTDYNDGFVLPAAIGFHCWAAISPRWDNKLAIYSEEFGGGCEIDLSPGAPRPAPSGTWSDYPVGVALELEKSGLRLAGANLLLHGDVPIGAGLSSSAAIEVVTAVALTDLFGHPLDPIQLARICQKAENDYVGMKCGIMDQFISLHGRSNHALMLDCRSLDCEFVPVAESVRLVICNTGVKHQLAGGEYNRRRAECEEAVRSLAKLMPEVRALRDVSRKQLEQHRGALSDIAYKRALHVVTENARVLDGVAALRARDLTWFGKCMNQSHESLRDLYEVSCHELNLMVDLAHKQSGVFGARMTGGGFGGATVNLVEAGCAEKFAASVAEAYQRETKILAQIYICKPVEGATQLSAAELRQ